MPAEALVRRMKGEVAVYDNAGEAQRRTSYLIRQLTSNPKDPTQIISGNEKVVRPRLADAEFFFSHRP